MPDEPFGLANRHVVGIVGHVRVMEDGIVGPSRYYQLYSARPVPKPPIAPPPSRRNSAVPSFGFLTITARIDSPERMQEFSAPVHA